MTQKDVFMKRRSIGFTEKAADNLKNYSKKLGLSQFELMSMLLEEYLDINDPNLKQSADTWIGRVNARRDAERLLKQKLRERMKELSPEEMEKALRAIGK